MAKKDLTMVNSLFVLNTNTGALQLLGSNPEWCRQYGETAPGGSTPNAKEAVSMKTLLKVYFSIRYQVSGIKIFHKANLKD
jgi:hypothetical protein